jgi:hypothetical protein
MEVFGHAIYRGKKVGMVEMQLCTANSRILKNTFWRKNQGLPMYSTSKFDPYLALENEELHVS